MKFYSAARTRSLARHKLRVILICLICGSIVNVILAWGIALAPKSKWKGTTQPQSGYIESPWPAGVPATNYVDCYQAGRVDYLGFTRIGYVVGDVKNVTNPGNDPIAHSFQYGIPARSLEYTFFKGFPGSIDSVWGVLNISAVHKMLGLANSISTGLPIQPRPLGFAINTIAYALPVYAIWFGTATLRKRRRLTSSICTQCGYDVSGASQCPECGEVVSGPEE